MDQLLEFTGRFHPLLVHLPIGFLLIAVIFIWLQESIKVVRISLYLGTGAAVLSMVTGLMLESGGGYDESVNIHKWSGISLTAASLILCFLPTEKLKKGSIALTFFLVMTGHLGGELTHGSLFAAPVVDLQTPDLSELDMNTAVLYSDAVRPVLEARCYGCHGEAKQKGKLRLDSPEMITKGGKNGRIIVPGNPAESEMIIRIDLPADDEDHMPPKEKKQLTDQEKKLISLWVAAGGNFTKKVTELIDRKQLDELLSGSSGKIVLPDVDVPAPDEDLVAKLTERGVAITPVADGSDFLQVNFVSVPEEASELLAMLTPLTANVVSLKLMRTNITDFSPIGDFSNLTDLNLGETEIGDEGLGAITNCKFLTTLNLQGTRVTEAGIEKLKACPRLRYLNLYKTSIKSADLPGVTIEFGGYDVPTLPTDTAVVRPKKSPK